MSMENGWPQQLIRLAGEQAPDTPETIKRLKMALAPVIEGDTGVQQLNTKQGLIDRAIALVSEHPYATTAVVVAVVAATSAYALLDRADIVEMIGAEEDDGLIITGLKKAARAVARMFGVDTTTASQRESGLRARLDRVGRLVAYFGTLDAARQFMQDLEDVQPEHFDEYNEVYG